MTETTADHNGEPSTKQADPAPAKPKPSYRYRGGNDPPTALAHLRNAKRWVAWDYRLKSDKWTKPPFDPRTGRNASVSDPNTWTTFDEALAGMRKFGLAGGGLVLTKDGGISGVDLDDCISDSGSLTSLAAEVIDYGETYAETSPSGEGVRLFVSGDAPTLKEDGIDVEVYSSGRYLTVTGQHIDGTPTEIRLAPRTLELLAQKVEAARGAARQAKQPERQSRRGTQPQGDFFANVNKTALERRDDWVPTLLPEARKQATGAWRVSSAALDRDFEEDLSIHPTGIQDFGPRKGLTPIDLVLEFGHVAKASVRRTGCARPWASIRRPWDGAAMAASISTIRDRRPPQSLTCRSFGEIELRPRYFLSSYLVPRPIG